MKRNRGFSLVELMVAMVIGLIIILGAGQLFLTVFQTNRQVETLSEKQAAVNFAVEVLLRDIRRADPESIDWNGDRLLLRVPNRRDVTSSCNPGDTVEKVYRLSSAAVGEGEGWALEVSQSCNGSPSGFQQVVTALASNGFSVQPVDVDDGVWGITLELMPTGNNGTPDSLVFYAVNRTAAATVN